MQNSLAMQQYDSELRSRSQRHRVPTFGVDVHVADVQIEHKAVSTGSRAIRVVDVE